MTDATLNSETPTRNVELGKLPPVRVLVLVYIVLWSPAWRGGPLEAKGGVQSPGLQAPGRSGGGRLISPT